MYIIVRVDSQLIPAAVTYYASNRWSSIREGAKRYDDIESARVKALELRKIYSGFIKIVDLNDSNFVRIYPQ